MTAQEIFYIIAAWVLFIFSQSMILNGIKIAASGTTETMPNGKEKDSQMILYPIAKWLDRHYMKRVYYQGEELDKLILTFKKEHPQIMPTNYLHRDAGILFNNDTDVYIMQGLVNKKEMMGIKYELHGRRMVFYKEYKEYRLSKWWRLPTLGCIRCMSSYWSLVTFWLPLLIVFGFHWWMLLVWLANVPSVTFVNTFIAQRYNEN